MTDTSIKWRITWKMWFPIVLFMIPLILEKQIAGTYLSPFLYGVLVLVLGIIYYFRFRLWQSLLVMGMTTIAIWGYFLAARPVTSIESLQLIGLDLGPQFVLWLQAYFPIQIWLVILITNGVIYYTAGPALFKALNLEESAIRLFKLAAREVSGEQNGFTGRPFLVGQHPYSRNKVIGFASFLEKNKICQAEFSGKGIKLIFSMGISPLSNKYKDKLSYVYFGEDGRLSVFISERDYRQYKREYTFDQLCDLMGKTFLRFASYYDENLDRRIITELKSA